ncbi:MAG: response regulator [Reichenbachiella sp.]|uniref:response regulator n=1 Tax=Reichenbachiella sp. TaxID=2184521 RepID=UPI003267D0BA
MTTDNSLGKKVLIVDDSMYMRLLIKKNLTKAGFEVIGEAADGESAVSLALKISPDLITLDNILPDMYGTDILKLLASKGVKSKIIMISAVGQHSIISESLSLGAVYYVVKPFTSEVLVQTAIDALGSKEY